MSARTRLSAMERHGVMNSWRDAGYLKPLWSGWKRRRPKPMKRSRCCQSAGKERAGPLDLGRVNFFFFIVMAHAAIVAAVALWYAPQSGRNKDHPYRHSRDAGGRVESSSHEVRPGHRRRADHAKQARPRRRSAQGRREAVERWSTAVAPQQAEVTLPQVEPKEVEKPRRSSAARAGGPRAPKKRSPRAVPRSRPNAYNALVFADIYRVQADIRRPLAQIWHPLPPPPPPPSVVLRFVRTRGWTWIEKRG